MAKYKTNAKKGGGTAKRQMRKGASKRRAGKSTKGGRQGGR
jgi:hypothetical protein